MVSLYEYGFWPMLVRLYETGDKRLVGCQTITRKQRLKLFKLLADDLGYELTED